MSLIEKINKNIQYKEYRRKKNNAPYHQSIATTEELREMHFELLPHRAYFPDLATNDYYLFVALKKMLIGRRSLSNEEMIAETNAFFGG